MIKLLWLMNCVFKTIIWAPWLYYYSTLRYHHNAYIHAAHLLRIRQIFAVMFVFNFNDLRDHSEHNSVDQQVRACVLKDVDVNLDDRLSI